MNVRIICWDLDDTLGSFTRLAFTEPPSHLEPLGLRHGIRDTLSNLARQGFTHCVCTSATRDYTEEALRQSALRHHFSAVFDRSVTIGLNGKRYAPVAAHFGLTEEAAAAHMIVLGDSMGDRSLDVNGLVLIRQTAAHRYDARVVEIVLSALEKADATSFSEAFDSLYRTCDTELVAEGRNVDLVEGVSLCLGYSLEPSPDSSMKRISIATLVCEDKYQKPLVAFG